MTPNDTAQSVFPSGGGEGGRSVSTTGAQKASSSSPGIAHGRHYAHARRADSSSVNDSSEARASSNDDDDDDDDDVDDDQHVDNDANVGSYATEEVRGRSRLRNVPAISTTGGGGGGLDVQGIASRPMGGHGTSTPFSPFSPMGSSAGFDTPQEVGSPNLSNKAFHGSIVNGLLFPRGMRHEQDPTGGRQDGLGGKNWEEMLLGIASHDDAPVESQSEDVIDATQDCPKDKDSIGSVPVAMPVPAIEVQGDDAQADRDPLTKLTKALEDGTKRDEGKSPGGLESKRKPVYRNDRVIAIDFDDVCSQNMAAIIDEHNVQYGTDLTLDDLQTYVFWQNRGWGTPADVARKVMTLNHLLPQTAPIPGFASALRHLRHTLGHPIHIITSRPASDREPLTQWLKQQGITIGTGPDDIIEEAWFTGTYGDVNIDVGVKGEDQKFEAELNRRLKELWRDGVGQSKGGLGKLKILRQIKASLFIDDHHGNLEPILSASPPIPCLLFGRYGWNAARSGIASPVEMMDYEERIRAGLPLPREEIPFGQVGCGHGENGQNEGGGELTRTESWADVIKWVEEWDRKAVQAVCGDT
ncbi:hypothetical protein I317_03246 [Kwoniella heveanensis CBS 569]|nr:hypothetical protein I317_03246 [Kwoniella heveanensis CBS 569]